MKELTLTNFSYDIKLSFILLMFIVPALLSILNWIRCSHEMYYSQTALPKFYVGINSSEPSESLENYRNLWSSFSHDHINKHSLNKVSYLTFIQDNMSAFNQYVHNITNSTVADSMFRNYNISITPMTFSIFFRLKKLRDSNPVEFKNNKFVIFISKIFIVIRFIVGVEIFLIFLFHVYVVKSLSLIVGFMCHKLQNCSFNKNHVADFAMQLWILINFMILVTPSPYFSQNATINNFLVKSESGLRSITSILYENSSSFLLVSIVVLLVSLIGASVMTRVKSSF